MWDTLVNIVNSEQMNVFLSSKILQLNGVWQIHSTMRQSTINASREKQHIYRGLGNCEVKDVLIGLIVVTISACIRISNPHTVHFKYMQFLFVSYSSPKLVKIAKKKKK